jgi:hypothetical protein
LDVGRIILIVIVILWLYTIMAMVRLHFISMLTKRVLNEEGDFLYNHRKEFEEGLREGPYFQRYHSLPPTDTMIHSFWQWPGNFERALKPLEEYYPLKKKKATKKA